MSHQIILSDDAYKALTMLVDEQGKFRDSAVNEPCQHLISFRLFCMIGHFLQTNEGNIEYLQSSTQSISYGMLFLIRERSNRMAAQPIYPGELNLAMDRQFGRITDYVDARFDKVLTQMRVDRQEALIRDESLLKRISDVEQHLDKRISGIEQHLDKRISGIEQHLDKRISDVEAFQRTMLETFQTTTQAVMKSIADSHATLSEQINEIKKRLDDKE